MSGVPKHIAGLRALTTEFDAFLVDVWGVLHDGNAPFPPVIAALRALRDADRAVVLVTNTSRLAPAVVDTLTAMGIERTLFQDIVTAGDVTRAALTLRDPALFEKLPPSPRCFHWGNPDFVPWLFELGLDFTDDVAMTDLVIATGAVADADALARARAELEPAAARNVPLVCTNPDRLIPTAAGMRLGPGALARAYAESGPPIFLYGKPHLPIYVAARQKLGADTKRIIALGDTLETDMRGATAAGIAAAFIARTGVHAAERDVASLFAREGIVPDYVLPAFAY